MHTQGDRQTDTAYSQVVQRRRMSPVINYFFQLAAHHFARIPAGSPGCSNALHEISRMQVSDIRVRAQFTSEACAGSFLLLQRIRKETLVFPMVFIHFQRGTIEHCMRTLASAALHSTPLRCRAVPPAPPCGASGRATVWRGDNCRGVQKTAFL